MPAIGSSCTVRIDRGIPIVVFAVDAVIRVVAGLGAVAYAFRGAFFRSGFRGYKSALRILGGFCDDVNHAVDGISAP